MMISQCIICEHLNTKTCSACVDNDLLQIVTDVTVWRRYRDILHYIINNQIQDPEPAEEINEEKE